MLLRPSALAGLALILLTPVTADAATTEIPLGPGAEVTCVTGSQLIENMAAAGCDTRLRDERDRLHAQSLADSEPIVVVMAGGRILRGRSSIALSNRRGHSEITDGKLMCRSDYDAKTPWKLLSIPIRCSDGRTGIAKVTEAFATQSEGTIRMSDGERAQYAVGCMKQIGAIRACPVVTAPPPVLVIEPLPPARTP